MGGLLPFLIFFSYYSSFLVTSSLEPPQYNSTATPNDNATSLVPPPSPASKEETAPFRPNVAVIVGVLTTIFSLTILLLLYAKNCKRSGGGGSGAVGSTSGNTPIGLDGGRKDSGINRAVIESLPIFRFGSLLGQTDGLECAVCLSRFEQTEVLRLLPKCKHAFHVECVDTWLDAHSTCPLCRYRVDPEDVLLIHEPNRETVPFGVKEDDQEREKESEIENCIVDFESGISRVSGRHSSAGERGGRNRCTTSFSLRRSLDGFGFRRKSRNCSNNNNIINSDSRDQSVAVGCVDGYARKDGLLLTREGNNSNKDAEVQEPTVSVVGDVSEGEGTEGTNRTRFEHRINVVSSCRKGGGAHMKRWSDVQPSDFLYLRSEMLMSDGCRRYSASGSRPSVSSRLKKTSGGRSVINTRSVSEIMGMNRFSPSGNNSTSSTSNNNTNYYNALVSRWLPLISSSSSSPAPSDNATADTAPTTNV